jgi:drug/metabolite transporter superfamily protein YnfA
MVKDISLFSGIISGMFLAFSGLVTSFLHNRTEIIGALIILIGISVIFYLPHSKSIES